ncbi:hypothetical protein [Oceanimonas doudoroffii]|uniref:hypothetical protein n=1 Tax=Oceanimonas doudoroffii TaxID=84158 RepID=UPI003CCBA22F
MCSGGRIINYINAALNDSFDDVLFVGYQAEGVLGRDMARKEAGWIWMVSVPPFVSGRTR